MKNVILSFLLLLFIQSLGAQDSLRKKEFIYFPGSYQPWDYTFTAGISLMRLPNEIIEEEINSLPMANGEFVLGLPKKFTLRTKLSSNYISNMASVAIQKNILDRKIALSAGINGAIWYGQLYQEVIQLRAFGAIFNPFLVAGIQFKDFFLTCKLENQYGFMRTFSDKSMLGKSVQPNSAYSLQFAIEQPLWNHHWVALTAKFNYAKFQYQSWLVYSATDQYLFYPEYAFVFIF